MKKESMRLTKILVFLTLLFAAVACFKDPGFEAGFTGEDDRSRSMPERSYVTPERRVMLMVSAGFNSLSNYLSEDLEELEVGYVPEGKHFASDVLLVLARLPKTMGDYKDETAPVLYRLYKDREGEVIKDTLHVWAPTDQICRKEMFAEALDMVRKGFPARGYGMVYSSHATGWLPDGYYSSPQDYENAHAPRRSIGQDRSLNGDIEMELKDFAEAIPMHLDYLLLDACLCACVEVAYAFRDKADIVGFSPTEVLAEGFNYLTITEKLLGGSSDPIGVCQDYFAFYDSQSGSNRSATITAVAPAKMQPLAEVCKELFEKYRPAIHSLNGNNVQGYFRYNRHYFYDLKDILVQAGINAQETARLDAALKECILYKAATDYFLSIPLKRVCGLSMYLPSMGTTLLDNFYKANVDWNTATQLVK